VTLLIGLISLLLFASPLPSFDQVARLKLSTTLAIAGVPILLVIYPLYVMLCIWLALSVLRRPAPSLRLMGDQARRRARPWLIASTLIQLLASLLVAGVIGWVLSSARQTITIERYTLLAFTIGWFDLLIAGLIGLAVAMLGQAIVAYAVFAGITLPQSELRRQWYNAIILAVGYGIVVGWSLALDLLPIYSLLLTTLLMTTFFALLTWRAYTRHEHYIRRLRPFVASQHLYEQLLTPTATNPPSLDVETPFLALCEDILNTRLAHLIPLGPLAPLVTSLTYPTGRAAPPTDLTNLVKRMASPQTIFVPLDPEQTAGVAWAVPLWSERGLIGLFLLGSKVDEDLYTQEELEIARASAERLIDTQASAEIARRLMALQRERLTESRLLDRQTRRVLHDTVLPQLHTALLTLSATSSSPHDQTGPVIDLLTEAHQQISNLLHEIPTELEPTLTRRGVVGALRQVVESELAHAFEAVTWQIEPAAEQATRQLSPLIAEVLLYAVREALRNAARHGRGDDPQRLLHVVIRVTHQPELAIQVEDDGVGLNTGASTSGGGQGLALHSTMLAVVGGTLDVERVPGDLTRVTVRLPNAPL
jgi:signal transduction histidine kinase